jgi:hypothetical protein
MPVGMRQIGTTGKSNFFIKRPFDGSQRIPLEKEPRPLETSRPLWLSKLNYVLVTRHPEDETPHHFAQELSTNR